ncbi:ubiquinone anaerobic biosynthesis accessory factor UbiT [Aeromonas molluscorum]|uniref:Ubiquinone biosynthesis accessory factor UbiT n=1 Tax=Aeromonas molluscorum 848 TaxID=1268236 RepID=R1F636_9GAMM|nr:SCP2 sterol-binding domain-containing protein [Aeromonas molluscorum]EOD55237.1 lipid carrier protein [Aeromonas molluscorum 848]
MFQQLQHRLVERAPQLLRRPLGLVPFTLQRRLMEPLLARVFREAIADGDLDFLTGKWLKVEVTDLALRWFISLREGHLVLAEGAPRVDVCFSGGSKDLILIAARREDPDTLFFQRRLKIEGDTELGLELKNLIDSLDLASLPALLKYPLLDLAYFIEREGAASEQAVATAQGAAL